MKSVTAGFTFAQSQPDTYPVTYVYYKRRYWSGSAYVWETDWSLLANNEVDAVSPIAQQFDVQTLNEFRVDNLTLVLKNFSGKWIEANPGGIFGADGVSTFGYEPYLMKFQIRTGFSNVGGADLRQGGDAYPSGGDELLTIFTGVATDYIFSSESQTVELVVESMERILLNADAEALATSVTLETIGTGDGANNAFLTGNNGVANITEVTVNAVTQIAGSDYEISGLNGFDSPAQVLLYKPPAAGYLIKCSYSYWPRNKTVDQFISDLVAQAGITSTDIDEATLGTISNNITLSSKGEFDAGTNTSIDTATKSGVLQVDHTAAANLQLWNAFGSGTPASNGWSDTSANVSLSFDVSGGELFCRADALGNTLGAAIRRSYTSAIAFGTWKFDIRSEAAADGSFFFNIWFMANSDTENDNNGYYLRVFTGISGVADLQLVKKVEGQTQEIIGTALTGISWTSTKTIQIERSIEKEFRVYVDGVLYISVVDDDFDSGDRMVIEFDTGSTSKEIFVDNIYIPQYTMTATHVSPSIDTISGLTAWGKLSAVQDISVGTLTFETRVSSDNSTWDPYVGLSATDMIQSDVKRYIQVKITFSVSSGVPRYSVFSAPPLPQNLFTGKDAVVPSGDPFRFNGTRILEVYSYTVQFTSNRMFVAMGNYAGMSCYQAIQELAKLTDFEWGMNNEEFFFRSRTVSSTPDVAFDGTANLASIVFLKYGFENVVSVVRAEFGSFVAEEAAAPGSRTSAVERYKKIIFTLGSSILINQDTNIAGSIAAAYFARLKDRKKRARIRTKYYPQIELSDTVQLDFNYDPYSQPAVYPLASALICKVIGTRHDPTGKISEFDLEEIV